MSDHVCNPNIYPDCCYPAVSKGMPISTIEEYEDHIAAAERLGVVTAEHDWKTRLNAEMEEAERKAWDSLSRYKFQMFGYWAAIWVHLNKLHEVKRANPFKCAVELARDVNRDYLIDNDLAPAIEGK